MCSTQIMPGTYIWELVFNYDNTGTPNTSSFQQQITVETQTNFKEFMSSEFNVTRAYSFNNELSFGLSYEGLDASTGISYSTHEEFANQIINSSETGKDTNTTTTTTQSFTCPGGSKMSMYRLVFETNYGSVRTDILSSSPLPDVKVGLKFDFQQHVLGLNQILYQFGHTFPASENTVEWASIRDDITSNADKSETDRFHAFVIKLSTITPGSSNVNEWSEIRGTCNEILASWDTTDKQSLFNKLLLRFTQTIPGSSNVMEWKAISDLSNTILQQTTLTFGDNP